MNITVESLDINYGLYQDVTNEIDFIFKVIHEEFSAHDIFYNLETLLSYIEMKLPRDLKYLQQIIMARVHPDDQHMEGSAYHNFNDFVPNICSLSKIYHCHNLQTYQSKSIKVTLLFKNKQ